MSVLKQKLDKVSSLSFRLLKSFKPISSKRHFHLTKIVSPSAIEQDKPSPLSST